MKSITSKPAAQTPAGCWDDWDAMLPKFVKVMPHDYKRILMERAAAFAAD